jgi:hypothetical protein
LDSQVCNYNRPDGSEIKFGEYDWAISENPLYPDVYGELYFWGTVMNGAEGSDTNPSGVQGICPEG